MVFRRAGRRCCVPSGSTLVARVLSVKPCVIGVPYKILLATILLGRCKNDLEFNLNSKSFLQLNALCFCTLKIMLIGFLGMNMKVKSRRDHLVIFDQKYF